MLDLHYLCKLIMMIEARNIVKRYGDLEVLRGVDLDIAQGEIVSIVGPSGAGKTTLLQIRSTCHSKARCTMRARTCWH